MIFLEYPCLSGYKAVWVAVVSGTPENGGVGVEFSDTHAGERKERFSFSSDRRVSGLNRKTWTEDTAPPEILAAWARYSLMKGK